jgi:hypothetical protein
MSNRCAKTWVTVNSGTGYVELDGVNLVVAKEDIECSVAIGARTQGYGFTRKRFAKAEVLASKADPAAILNATDIVVGSVFHGWQLARH